MFVLDTDTLTLLLRGHKRVMERRARVTDEVTLTLITRIEVLQGRFASVLTALAGAGTAGGKRKGPGELHHPYDRSQGG
jgi:hypothetical protein